MHLLHNYLGSIEIQDKEIARLICLFIPDSCPFARTVYLFGRVVAIPPLCKINPLYDDLMQLRFKALEAIAR